MLEVCVADGNRFVGESRARVSASTYWQHVDLITITVWQTLNGHRLYTLCFINTFSPSFLFLPQMETPVSWHFSLIGYKTGTRTHSSSQNENSCFKKSLRSSFYVIFSCSLPTSPLPGILQRYMGEKWSETYNIQFMFCIIKKKGFTKI